MTLRLVSRPANYPITLSEAKAHLREDGSEQDATIVMYIAAATANAEAYLGRALIDQTWDYHFGAFPITGGIPIPKPPLLEVLGVFSTDAAGAETPFTNYRIDYTGQGAELVLATSASAWPSSSTAGRIRFRAGYLDSTGSPPLEAVPEDIKAAILLILGNLYANRESVVIGVMATELPMAAQWLMQPHSVRLRFA